MTKRKFVDKRLFEPLGDVSQGHGEGLHRGEGVLKVQRVRVGVYPPKLHDLSKRKSWL